MRVIFVSIKHRDSPLFNDGMNLLKKDGFPVHILDNRDDNYDNGVVKMATLLRGMEWDIVHFVDNDCFITDTTYIKQTLKDFEESDLGWVSHFENGWGNDCNKYKYKGTIAEVTDQKFIKEYPFMVPSWENAMMMFKREAWNAITDYSDLQKWLPELVQKGFKIGVKKIEPRLKYTHKGEGFVHIGNLFPYQYKVENGERIEIDEITKPRIGYFQKYFDLQGYPDFTKRMGGTYKVNYQNGVMPTNEWFEKIKAHVDFKGKEVIDVGCAEGVMCKLAMEAGAKQAFGIDNQEHFIPSGGVIFYLGNIEDKVFHGDIKIFSMIIHWLGKDKFLQQLQSGNEIIVIFRLPNDGYQIPQNGKWFPTLDELDEVLDGFRRVHSELLMEQDNGKQIMLAIYDKKV